MTQHNKAYSSSEHPRSERPRSEPSVRPLNVQLLVGRIITCLVFIVACAAWRYMAVHVPLNNDEAIQFQPIACTYFPNATLHQFREACGEKDLIIFGTRLPLRAFHYIGAGSALFFAPVWWLIDNPLALRVWTGLLWLASSIIMSRILRIPWALIMSVVMLSTPVFAQNLVDTGPFAWPLFLILSGVLLIIHALSSRAWWSLCLCSALAGICAFLAFEQKGFVVHGLCAASYLFLVASYRRGLGRGQSLLASATKLLSVGVIFGSVAGALLWLLLTAKTVGGGYYYQALESSTAYFSFGDIQKWLDLFWNLVKNFIYSPISYFHRVYGLNDGAPRFGPPGWDMFSVTWLIRITVGAGMLLLLERKWAYVLFLILALLFAGGDLFLIARAQRVWAGHHVIFAHILVFIGLAVALGALLPRYFMVVAPAVAFLLYIQVKPWQSLVASQPLIESDPTRMELIAIADQPEFASKYLVTHASWGTYFIDALFGPKDQAVTWVEMPDQKGLEDVARASHRQLAFIRFRSDTGAQSAWDEYAKRRNMQLRATSSSGKWELWVEPETPPSPSS